MEASLRIALLIALLSAVVARSAPQLQDRVTQESVGVETPSSPNPVAASLQLQPLDQLTPDGVRGQEEQGGVTQEATEQSQEGDTRDGNTEQTRVDNELIQLRLEKIKQGILQQLGLSSPPQVRFSRIPKNIPEPLQIDDKHASNEYLRENDEDEEGEHGTDEHARQNIVFGEEVPVLRNRRPLPKHIFRFTFPKGLSAQDISSVKLWLYKSNDSESADCTTSGNDTLTVNYQPYHRSSKRPSDNIGFLVSQHVPQHPGWFHVNLDNSLSSKIRKTSRMSQDIGVDHGECFSLGTTLNHRPFLSIGTDRNEHRRQRRNAGACIDGSQNCCRKKSLYVNFREFRWDFIMSPDGYYANYCSGQCSMSSLDNLLNVNRAHSYIIQKHSQAHNSTATLPCCSPKSFSSLSLLYQNNDGAIIREDLQNMRVESCGC